jgi:arylsulfatase A-like enzyme
MISLALEKMSSSKPVLLLAAALFCASCSDCDSRPNGTGRASRAEHGGTNVLLVSVDTLRADHLGCYGYKRIETPNIDALASKGWLFEQAFSAAPVTAPSHATILTGLLPFAHGVRENGTYELAKKHATLAEILSAAGYETFAFVSSFVLDSRFGLDQGFSVYNDDFSEGDSIFSSGVHRWQGHEFDNFERHAGLTNRAVFDWLRKPHLRPFFLWVHYFDPHHPYSPPEPWSERYRNHLYDGEIAYDDFELGRLLDELNVAGELERTLVVFVADHGEGLGQHEKTHGKTLFNPLVRVPLIIVPPGGLEDGGRRVGPMVRTIDIVPTVLEMLNMERPPALQGRSLVQLLKAGASSTPPQRSYSETHRLERPYRGGILRGLRTPRWSYTVIPRDGVRQLYDIEADPGEKRNLADDLPERAERMQRAMAELIREQSPRGGEEGVEREMSEEVRRKLEALGYIDKKENQKEDQ